jgi:hypothetical protein
MLNYNDQGFGTLSQLFNLVAADTLSVKVIASSPDTSGAVAITPYLSIVKLPV